MTNLHLVTGATGFTGSYMLRYLLHKGEKVRALKRPDSSTYLVNDIQNNVEWVDADLLDIYALDDALEGVSHVYHCAGIVSYLSRDRDLLLQVNGEGTANLVNACLDKPAIRLLHVSSVAALGKKTLTSEAVSEQTKWEFNKSVSDYSASKFRAEQEVWRGVAEGLNAVVINPSVILGAGDWDKTTGRLFSNVYHGFPFYTKGSTGFVDVRDVVQIAYTLLQNEHWGERYVLNAENMNYHRLFELIAHELGVPPPRWEAGPVLSSLAWRWSALQRLLGKKNTTLTRTTAAMANRNNLYNATKINDAMNNPFRPLSSTIADTCRSFLETQKDGIHHPLKF
jgi:dihydroflavonol-4-reductase